METYRSDVVSAGWVVWAVWAVWTVWADALRRFPTGRLFFPRVDWHLLTSGLTFTNEWIDIYYRVDCHLLTSGFRLILSCFLMDAWVNLFFLCFCFLKMAAATSTLHYNFSVFLTMWDFPMPFLVIFILFPYLCTRFWVEGGKSEVAVGWQRDATAKQSLRVEIWTWKFESQNG